MNIDLQWGPPNNARERGREPVLASLAAVLAGYAQDR